MSTPTPSIEAAEDASLDALIDSFARTKAAEAQATSASASASAGPSAAPRKEITMAEFQSVLDSTPLFMRETPDGSEENPVLDALRSLVFDGEGDVALNFKDHGNELYVQKSYKDAVVAYTSGLDAGPTDPALRITLLNNRAACNLALKNFGMVLKDAGTVIALCVQEGRDVPNKALYRAAQALVGLERWKEARDVVGRGKDGGDAKSWKEVEGKVERGQRAEVERAERLRRERLSKKALREAVQSRGLVIIDTPSPPDNPNPLHFDPSYLPATPLSDTTWDPPALHTPLIYPVFLLYPSHAQSDLITHFNETTSFGDHLAAMFPSSPAASSGWTEWDSKREYHSANLVVYVETRHRRLLKVGKDLPLVEVLAKGVKMDAAGRVGDGVVLRDGLLSFVVLVKGEQEKAWIADFKAKRDGT